MTVQPSRAGRSPWSHGLALAAAVLITLAGGVLYGKYAQRWGPPPDMLAAATKLDQLPRQLGPWTLVETLTMEDSTLEMLECAGYVNRSYMNQETGQTVGLAIIVGPPGPTAVHTPEICFSSRAYEQQGDRRRVNLDASPVDRQSFWSIDFSTRNVLADGLRVYYAWSAGENWEAADSPRFEFAAAPYLFKIQLAAPRSAGLGAEGPDAGQDFLEEFLRSGWPRVRPEEGK